MKRSFQLSLEIALIGGMVACGGGGGGGSTEAPLSAQPTPTIAPVPTTAPTIAPVPTAAPSPVPTSLGTIKGQLLTPEQIKSSGAKILLQSGSAQRGTSACPDIPNGYLPVSNSKVDLTDANNKIVAPSLTTDPCGNFSGDAPSTATQVKAVSVGNQDVLIPIADLLNKVSTKPSVYSFVPSNAKFIIASLQLSNGKLAFSIIDDQTNKSVLGLNSKNFQLSISQQGQAITAVSSASAASGSAASIVLVLDASGSMSSSVFDPVSNKYVKDANGVDLSALRMAALASHAFLDAKSPADELAMIIFDSKVNFIDDAWLAAYQFTDAIGGAVKYSFSVNGFSTDSNTSRLLVDMYNRSSKLYSATGLDALHAKSPQGYLAKFKYLWGGGTAIYDAANTGLEKLKTGANSRKIVVTMTDGDDTSSKLTEAGLIANGKAAGIPIWTVAFGDGGNVASLQKISKETNGNYISSVNQSTLAAQFQSIQTGIVHQYLLSTAAAINPTANSEIKLTLNYQGQKVERSLIVQ